MSADGNQESQRAEFHLQSELEAMEVVEASRGTPADFTGDGIRSNSQPLSKAVFSSLAARRLRDPPPALIKRQDTLEQRGRSYSVPTIQGQLFAHGLKDIGDAYFASRSPTRKVAAEASEHGGGRHSSAGFYSGSAPQGESSWDRMSSFLTMVARRVSGAGILDHESLDVVRRNYEANNADDDVGESN